MENTLPVVRQPAEWEPHSHVWTAWPSHAGYWDGYIDEARLNVAAMIRALAQPVPDHADPEEVCVWVDPMAAGSARLALDGMNVRIEEELLGDIWFRDIAPVFVRDQTGEIQYRRFGYNGWGNKYHMQHDDTVAERIASRTGMKGVASPFILEGGAIDVNGEGIGITTESCVLNPNRNQGASRGQVEAVLNEHFGIDSVVWLNDGLMNDHTDGHVDNIARFVNPDTVLCQHPSGTDDPNRISLEQIAADLRRYRSPSGSKLNVIEIPSPGLVTDSAGNVLPASHMNFYISNHRILVPCYGTAWEEKALSGIQAVFPGREVTGLPANGLLMGGGAFHCITQQQPV